MYEDLCAPMFATKEIKLFTCSGNKELSQEIADILHLEVSGLKLEKFANGEIYARFDESVRGDEVFLIQSIAGKNVNAAKIYTIITKIIENVIVFVFKVPLDSLISLLFIKLPAIPS